MYRPKKRQKPGPSGRRKRRKARTAAPHPDSPFAKLKGLVPAK